MPFLVNDTTPEREADVRTYLQSSVSLRLALRIVCTDGTVYAYTDAQNDVLLGAKSWGDITIPETLYKSGEGVFPSNIQQSRDPRKADTWEFKAFTDEHLTTTNVSKKQLKGATFSLIIFCADADYAWLRQRGQVGDESLDKGAVTYKMNGLSQKWQTEVIEVTSPVSRAKWGDDTLEFFDLDGDTADGFAARVIGVASDIDSDYPRRKFVCEASSSFPEHRFTDGTCEFLSGDNAGSTVTILNWSDDGTVLLDENAPFPIVAGDSVRLQIRAPKTIEEWILFFGDAKYFDGEAGIPGFEIASSIKRS